MSWLGSDDGDDYELDESDVRIRPSRRGSRPRTKLRPSHSEAQEGRVVAVNRGRYSVLLNGARAVTATRARELNRTQLVIGDRVAVVGDLSGEDGTLSRIVRIHERTTLLRRSADDSDQVERTIVANVDQLLIVVAAARPEPRVRLVDRYLVAAFDAGIRPMMCVTKTDLADPADFLANFKHLDLPVFLSQKDRFPLAELAPELANSWTVMVGHSGVGKSTLVNALVPAAQRATGQVNETTGRGRHTSSSSVALRFESDAGDGWIVDTPGIRSFGLGHVDADNIVAAFDDLALLATECPRGCSHLPGTAKCHLIELDNAGALSEGGSERLASLQRLLESRLG